MARVTCGGRGVKCRVQTYAPSVKLSVCTWMMIYLSVLNAILDPNWTISPDIDMGKGGSTVISIYAQ